MTCTPAGCSTDTSIKVKHRLPDFVVMSYPETGEAPWQDTDWISPDNAYSENGGHSARRSVQGLDNTSMRFYNSDVIGHSMEVETVQYKSIMTREEMRQTLFEYIEVDYNRTRRHGALGYLSPVNFEKQYVA